MKRVFIIIAIVGVLLLIVGGAVFAIGMSKLNWDFSALSTTEYSEDVASFAAEEVKEIAVDVGTAKLMFLYSDDDQITVQYFTIKDKKGNLIRKITPVLSEGVLTCKEEGKGYSFMDFDFRREEKVVVKAPADKVLGLSLKISTGEVIFGEEGKERRVSSLSIQSTTGDITLLGKTVCESDFSSEASTGSLRIKGDVVCGGDASLKSSTGDLDISAYFSAKKITLRTSTGDIESSKPLSFESLEAKASTGDIVLRVAGKKEEYSYHYEISTGESNLSSFAMGEKPIDICTSTGDIELYFAE